MFRCLLSLALCSAAVGQDAPGEKAHPKGPDTVVRVSKETTYITEPLDEDGYPDYVAALNARLSQGVTAGNNAYVGYRKVLGPESIGEKTRQRHLEAVGLGGLPNKGAYFVSLEEFLGSGKQAGERTDWRRIGRVWSGPWSAEDFPAVADWLQANEEQLDAVVEASQKSRCFVPLVVVDEEQGPAMISVLLPAAQDFRKLARGLVGRAMLRLDAGELDGAWEDLQATHRLARHTAQGATLIEGLVGIAIEAMATQGDVYLAQHPELTAQQAQRFEKQLRGLPKLVSMAETVETGERYVYLDAVVSIARSPESMRALGMTDGGSSTQSVLLKLVSRSLIDWNVPLEMGNDFYDRTAAAMRTEDAERREAEFEAISAEIERAKQDLQSPAKMALNLFAAPRDTLSRQMGTIFAALLLPAVQKSYEAKLRGEVKLDLARVAFALRAYREDEGAYPKTLGDLAPKYLPEVPGDPFAEAPLTYRRTDRGYLVYSVGPNKQDEGGKEFDGRTGTDDVAIRYPQTQPDESEDGTRSR